MRQLTHLRVGQKGKSCFLSPTRSADEKCVCGGGWSGSKVADYQLRIRTRTGPVPRIKKVRNGLTAARGESSHRPLPATPPRNPQASAISRTSRDPAPSFPDRLPAPFFTELGAQQGTEESGRKTGTRGTPGNVVQALQAAIFFRRGVGQGANKDYKSQPPFRFVFVQKKKKTPHSPSSLLSLSLTHTHAGTHIHTHTHGRHARIRASKGKPRLAIPARH